MTLEVKNSAIKNIEVNLPRHVYQAAPGCINLPRGVSTCPRVYQAAPRLINLPQGVSTCPGVYQPAPGCINLPQGVSTCPRVYQAAPRLINLPQGVSTCPGVYQPAPGCINLPQGVSTCPGVYQPTPGCINLPRALSTCPRVYQAAPVYWASFSSYCANLFSTIVDYLPGLFLKKRKEKGLYSWALPSFSPLWIVFGRECESWFVCQTAPPPIPTSYTHTHVLYMHTNPVVALIFSFFFLQGRAVLASWNIEGAHVFRLLWRKKDG